MPTPRAAPFPQPPGSRDEPETVQPWKGSRDAGVLGEWLARGWGRKYSCFGLCSALSQWVPTAPGPEPAVPPAGGLGVLDNGDKLPPKPPGVYRGASTSAL